jgi:hypothetical protein
MSINPLEATPYESSWRHGMVAVLMQPDVEHSATLALRPSHLRSYVAQSRCSAARLGVRR